MRTRNAETAYTLCICVRMDIFPNKEKFDDDDDDDDDDDVDGETHWRRVNRLER